MLVKFKQLEASIDIPEGPGLMQRWDVPDNGHESYPASSTGPPLLYFRSPWHSVPLAPIENSPATDIGTYRLRSRSDAVPGESRSVRPRYHRTVIGNRSLFSQYNLSAEMQHAKTALAAQLTRGSSGRGTTLLVLAGSSSWAFARALDLGSIDPVEVLSPSPFLQLLPPMGMDHKNVSIQSFKEPPEGFLNERRRPREPSADTAASCYDSATQRNRPVTPDSRRGVESGRKLYRMKTKLYTCITAILFSKCKGVPPDELFTEGNMDKPLYSLLRFVTKLFEEVIEYGVENDSIAEFYSPTISANFR
ncbi:hypothetical protein DFJ73DRAFT_960739 [Zopfochytrium polystomum]|nr:hypothetical protein DFJ73DRAFT_960739 [Zopfochytrium polystomum]